MFSQEIPSAMSLPEAFALACKLPRPVEVRVSHRLTGAMRTYTLNQAFAFIGRARPMHVLLDDPSVSQCHAYLQVVEGLPYCIDLGSRTGVVWDDGSQGRGWVFPGHTLRIGAFDVQVGEVVPDGVPPAQPEESIDLDPSRDDFLPSVVLEIHTSGGRRVTHSLERPITLIGRHPKCDIRFIDELSYFHCALINTPDGAWCLDILSRKGTLLNGRTTRLARLRDGDLLEIGKVSMLVNSDQTGQSLVLSGSGTGLKAIESATVVPQQMAESVTPAFAPLREVMDHFQQCFMTMAQMFATMQQEHTATVYEQMLQMQEMMKEFREMRTLGARNGSTPAEANGAAFNAERSPPPAAPAPEPRLPTQQRASHGAEAQALSDAHTWLLERLAKMGQPATTGSKG